MPEKLKRLSKTMWEYKMNDDDKTIHGPFSSLQMQDWKQKGYFTGGQSVLIRRHKVAEMKPSGQASSSSSAAADITDLMKDSDSKDEGDPSWTKEEDG